MFHHTKRQALALTCTSCLACGSYRFHIVLISLVRITWPREIQMETSNSFSGKALDICT